MTENDPREYMRVAADLRRGIGEGTYKPGKPVPSIAVLARQYGHARQTCGKAMRLLADENLLIWYQGRGYFVVGEDPDGKAA